MSTVTAGDGRPPANGCDSHCHVLGPAARFPYAATRRYEPADSPLETLRALHDRLGLSRAVIVQATAHGIVNDAMLAALRTAPDRYRGVAMIDDTTTDRELEEMARAGVRGVRFNFVQSLGGHPDPAVFRRCVERAKGLGWHVVLHVRGADLLELADTLRDLPVPFVIDHMGRVEAAAGVGQPAFQLLLRLLERHDAWVKISGPERMASYPYDDALPFARALAETRLDRILWGTDFPHPNLDVAVREEDLLAFLQRAVPDADDRRRVLVDNPAALYGFSAEC